MSVENGKVCCNCRHNIRQKGQDGVVRGCCEVHKRYLGYVMVMEHWCRHWAKEKDGEQHE